MRMKYAAMELLCSSMNEHMLFRNLTCMLLCLFLLYMHSTCSLTQFTHRSFVFDTLQVSLCSNKMRQAILLYFFLGLVACLSTFCCVKAEDPYRYYTFEFTYGQIAPLGVKQRGILVNGQFPGPTIDAITNDNVIVTVINKLDQPFLITWNGIKQRKVSWQDGVLGTNCPIPPNANWTYRMQVKDQIGTYSYFPSTLMHRAAGGFGAFVIRARAVIFVPYLKPAEEFNVLVNDWWNSDHRVLQTKLNTGKPMPFPDGLLINGLPRSNVFTGEKGKRYLFRVSNLGLTTSINFRIQGHQLKLIEIEGSHTMQEPYESLDIHVGQSVAVMITLEGTVKDYFIVASSRFTKPVLTTTAILRYAGSNTPASEPLPIGPTYQIHWSMKQARTLRWNLTANAARPNPQGSYHYGTIPIVRTLVLTNSAPIIKGKPRFAINKVSYKQPGTPLKLADYYNISGVYKLNTIKDTSPPGPAVLGTSVVGIELHDFVEIVFQNDENTIQSYHLDGSDFWLVGFGSGQWNSTMRKRYNLVDATTRYTAQVYPLSWTAILVSMDNKGMWNLRSAIWPRQHLGQQLYLRVWNDEQSLYTESDIPPNAILCGKAANL